MADSPILEGSDIKAETSGEAAETGKTPQVRSLRELIDVVTGRTPHINFQGEDSGIAEVLPFPFLSLVGQYEMKLALLLALINPAVGGVLLIGPRGTGKTTAVRSLIDLLPDVRRSACYYGCMPEDVESGGIDAICPDCARKYAEGKPLFIVDRARLIELPLNARLEDVIGGVDQRAMAHERLRLKRGLLSQADRNVLYIDEVNLLSDEIIDVILDAAAMGYYTVRRGAMSATYRARFTLTGSMNPEEGSLRPQIMDRFGLRVIVRGLKDPAERQHAYEQVRAYQKAPRQVIASYAQETEIARRELIATQNLLADVSIPGEISQIGIQLIQQLKIDSLRAEITLFEAARAYTAADGRTQVALEDLRWVAPLALRMRSSEFMNQFFQQQARQERALTETLNRVIPVKTRKKKSPRPTVEKSP